MTVRTGPAVRGVVAGANVVPECTRDSALAGSHDEDGEPDASHEVRTDMMVEGVQDADLAHCGFCVIVMVTCSLPKIAEMSEQTSDLANRTMRSNEQRWNREPSNTSTSK